MSKLAKPLPFGNAHSRRRIRPGTQLERESDVAVQRLDAQADAHTAH
jgi:hypothetical protein